jgi:lipid II:glycine glycyltransferase (peptidoglycan interpeptide bridge formation enzyme)
MEADLDRLRHDPAAWDAFVESTETDFPLQLSAWATAKASTGWQAERVVADGGSGPIGGLLLVRRLGPGPFAMGYLPRGPVARRFDAASVAAFTDALRRVARARRLTHVTADPGLEGNAHDSLLAGAGWRRADAVQLTSTQVIDLTRSEEALWSDVYKSSRRYANGARKRGCLVREGAEADLRVFYDILVETAERSGFIPRAFEAYREVYRAFTAQGRALLLIGSLPDGRDVSSKLILTCGGRASQLYGGLTDAGGEIRAGHFFEWQAIVRCKAAGARTFDMWGRSTPGIAHFKQGFGGRVVEYGGTWDLVVNPGVHALVQRGHRGLVWLARRRRGLDAGPGGVVDGDPAAATPGVAATSTAGTTPGALMTPGAAKPVAQTPGGADSGEED